MNKSATRSRPHPAHCTAGGIIDQCQRAASAAMKASESITRHSTALLHERRRVDYVFG